MRYQPLAYTRPAEKAADRPLRLALLGATGSIGRQTIDLVCAHPDLFAITAMSVNRRVDDAVALCRRVRPRYLVVCDKQAAPEAAISAELGAMGTEVLVGDRFMSEIATLDDVDMVVTATVGYSGFLPTVAAVRAGKDIALANKETLVVGGELIRRLTAGSTTRIFPIDSEHSAIAQCLLGESDDAVDRLVITASGGPFRTRTLAEMAKVRASDALKHPNWKMGAKITIDSATMMNKAFEIIEAHYLFGIPADRIDAVVHPQSVVHSMVQFVDGSLKAQLGIPDMHLPIAYALGLNNRIAGAERPLSLAELSVLTFEAPDVSRFPCLGFAPLALSRGGNTACIINAANEVAVDAFLNDRIRFTDIPAVIEDTLERTPFIANPDIADFVATNAESRRVAETLILTHLH